MKKVLLTLVLVLGMAGVAGATTLTDTTWFTPTGTNPAEDFVSHGWGDVNFLSLPRWGLPPVDYVVWKHHFIFTPPAAQILSATLTLSLRDEEGEGDSRLKKEYAFGWTESGQWDFGEVNTGDYSYDVNVNFLADGGFQVKLASVIGDFFIDKSELNIGYTAVPEPATLLFLGAGLLGMTALRRKLKK